MAYTIELIGPRGVGKTTLYQEVKKNLSKNDNCAGIEAFFPRINMSKNGLIGKVEYLVRKKLNKELKDQRAFQMAGYRFLKDNPDLTKLAWELINKYQQIDCHLIDNRFRTSYNLYNHYIAHQIIADSIALKYCLTGEGLIHTTLLIFGKDYHFSDLTNYLDRLPLPHYVIFCEASPEIIAKRCHSRTPVVTHIFKSYEDLLEDAIFEIQYYKQIQEYLIYRGVPVVKIDASLPIEENVSIILSSLRNLPKDEELIYRKFYSSNMESLSPPL
jgi:deoxyadenosine/deoxycytidine kinase